MFKRGLAVLFLLASWFSAACAYELLPAHVAVVYNGKSELSRRMAREYARVRGVPEGNLVSLDCPSANEISRKEYEDLIRAPLLRTAREQRWWVPSGIASAPMMDRKIFALVLMADLPMKIRHEAPVPPPGKDINQMQTDRAAVDSELALLAVDGYERKAWVGNPYFDRKEDFVGSGLPTAKLDKIIGVVKAYSSCVGEGPFTCEWFGEEAEKLREAGGEYGAKTGRPRRVGPIDIVATRYGIQCQGATDIALTKLDVLSYMDEIPICARYELNGQETDAFPFPAVLPDAKPVMTAMPGWKCDISGVRKWENLPEAARNYVEYVEREIGCHITYVSVGPERDSIIIR